ncbi:MAG TPA: phosphoribosylamine--glycine ligase [Flavobacteriales bacterium]|nr:phosphoribosylamine--glycine ligase [Flavobacteriales bacterium]
MNVLILGSGGREHALSWKIAQSPLLTMLYIAPGNAGTEAVGTNVDISVSDFVSIKEFVVSKGIDMVIVGPEAPLVEGIHDYFLNEEFLKNVKIVGPQREGAKLEGSKEFAKQFMVRNNIPTARHKSFSVNNLDAGYRYLDTLPPPYVLKADGLAAGKGVLILDEIEEAKKELMEMLENSKFGVAGEKVVVEEFLSGIELSVFAFFDGSTYMTLPTAKDYKRIGEGDTGLNTGGMGAISPVPFADEIFMKKVEEQIIKRTFDGLKNEGISYQGIMFFGLINVNGEPKVIEYNVRFGDPEAEVVIPRIKSDLLDLLDGVATGKLDQKAIEINQDVAATVIMVAGGYPEDYKKGFPITDNSKKEKSIVFHAGTKKINEKTLTNGGRVLAITSYGKTMGKALSNTYETIGNISFEGSNYRKDIGFDLKGKTAPL